MNLFSQFVVILGQREIGVGLWIRPHASPLTNSLAAVISFKPLRLYALLLMMAIINYSDWKLRKRFEWSSGAVVVFST